MQKRSKISKAAQKKSDLAREEARKNPVVAEKVDMDKPNNDGLMPGQPVSDAQRRQTELSR